MHNVTRRVFGLTALGAPLLSSPSAVLALDRTSKADAAVADRWVKRWVQESRTHKELKGPLDVRRFQDPFYILLAPIQWRPLGMSAVAPVTAPRGFVTDFASVPRAFWSLFRPDGNYAYAAVLHDYLYWQQDRPKAEADTIFRSAMSDLHITDREAGTLYQAVDKFGVRAWKSNAALKAKGEKRILKTLPENPAVTWADWKKRPDVFA